MVLAQLLWAGSVSLLSKSTAPAFVIFPGLLASYFLFGAKGPAQRWNFRKFSNLFALTTGLMVLLATAAWYATNYFDVMSHVLAASSGPVAEYWGREDTYLNKMVYWLGAIREWFFPKPVLWLYLVVLAAGIFGLASKKPFKLGFFDLCAAIAVAQLLLVLLMFSFSPLRVNSYFMPMLP